LGSVTLTLEEYERLLEMVNSVPQNTGAMALLDAGTTSSAKPRKKVSAYNRKYKKAFKKVSGKYRSKSGKWMKNGFKRAVKEAHKVAKK